MPTRDHNDDGCLFPSVVITVSITMLALITRRRHR